MNLGDLEFKPEDFVFSNVEGEAAILVAQASAERANCLLRERLAKAPEGTCGWPPHLHDAEISRWLAENEEPTADYTYRMVCGEIVKDELEGE